MKKRDAEPVRIGVISDTHGHLDPQVLSEFAGVTHIIHAGDVMHAAILEALELIAPVTAVAGNMDDGKLGKLPRETSGEVGGVRFAVGHKRKRLFKRLAFEKVDGVSKDSPPDLIVYGHDHLPAVEWVDGALWLDPGTASSPHEEDDDPTVAIVTAGHSGLEVRFIPLPRSPREDG